MSGLLDLLGSTLGDNANGAIGEKLGLSPQQSGAAIASALPMLLGALTRDASQPGSAEALLGALGKHDGSVLDDLRGQLPSAANTHGAGILGHVLGARQGAAQQAVAGASGIDAGQAGAVLAMLAPIVMGALGKLNRQQGLDAGGLTSLLQGARVSHSQAQPGLMGLESQLLDANHDGSIVDDITGKLGGLFGGR